MRSEQISPTSLLCLSFKPCQKPPQASQGERVLAPTRKKKGARRSSRAFTRHQAGSERSGPEAAAGAGRNVSPTLGN